MAKKTYDQDPPAHFNQIFIKNCFNCASCKWTAKHWYVCLEHNFAFNKVVGRPSNHTCGSWGINPKLLEMWGKQK